MDRELLGKKSTNVNMKLTHFPIIGNFATTGHKLQGKTWAILVIAEWRNVENWAYMILSRVRTLTGIFLLEALPDSLSFAPAPEYLLIMELLRKSVLVSTLTNNVCEPFCINTE